MAEQGHNSVTVGLIRSFIERAERIADEINVAQLDLKEVFAEAKAEGFDVKTLKRLIAMRKRNPDDLAEEQALLDLYASALGMEIFK